MNNQSPIKSPLIEKLEFEAMFNGTDELWVKLDSAIAIVTRHYEGRPAIPGKPLELQTRDELLAYISKYKSEQHRLREGLELCLDAMRKWGKAECDLYRYPNVIHSWHEAKNKGAAVPSGTLSCEEDRQKPCPAPANLIAELEALKEPLSDLISGVQNETVNNCIKVARGHFIDPNEKVQTDHVKESRFSLHDSKTCKDSLHEAELPQRILPARLHESDGPVGSSEISVSMTDEEILCLPFADRADCDRVAKCFIENEKCGPYGLFDGYDRHKDIAERQAVTRLGSGVIRRARLDGFKAALSMLSPEPHISKPEPVDDAEILVALRSGMGGDPNEYPGKGMGILNAIRPYLRTTEPIKDERYKRGFDDGYDAAKLEPLMSEVVDRAKVAWLRNEVNCRIEHGANSNGHLDHVQRELDRILADE